MRLLISKRFLDPEAIFEAILALVILDTDENSDEPGELMLKRCRLESLGGSIIERAGLSAVVSLISGEIQRSSGESGRSQCALKQLSQSVNCRIVSRNEPIHN